MGYKIRSITFEDETGSQLVLNYEKLMEINAIIETEKEINKK